MIPSCLYCGFFCVPEILILSTIVYHHREKTQGVYDHIAPESEDILELKKIWTWNMFGLVLCGSRKGDESWEGNCFWET